MSDDFVWNFADKVRHVDDEEMQNLWAEVLAREATTAGSFSRQTLHILSLMSGEDAASFTALASFCCEAGPLNDLLPFIYWRGWGAGCREIYETQGVTSESLATLDGLGLISMGSSYVDGAGTIKYHSKLIVVVETATQTNRRIPNGEVTLSRAGRELLRIQTRSEVTEFLAHIATQLKNKHGVKTAEGMR